jgi:Putative zinc-finger
MSACPAYETLVALWAGELPEAEAFVVDEHLFSCDACAAASERLAQVIGGLRATIPFVISHAHRDRLVSAGMRVHVTSVDPGRDPSVRRRARFAPDVDLLVFALRADVTRADRVDVDIVSPTGSLKHALEGVPFDRDTGEVLIACQRHFEGMFPTDPIFTVHAVEAGERRTMGDYVVTHIWR